MMEAGVSVRIFYVKGLLTSGSWVAVATVGDMYLVCTDHLNTIGRHCCQHF